MQRCVDDMQFYITFIKAQINDNKYMSKALNPSISDLHEAQSAVPV